MAILTSLLVLPFLLLLGFAAAEPDYCKRGVKISAAYQHCFEEAHFRHPYTPLYKPRPVIDGCFVEAYCNHTCRVVKPTALECFTRNISRCYMKERLFAIADESGGACFGNHINRIFKEHVLNFLEPVRGDSKCFLLADRAYQCYSHAGQEMADNNPNLDLLSIDDFIPVANQFFDTIYNCFVKIYKSNRRLCENWQIPMLLELQGTALPSLFGMSFTADQMDKLDLHRGCPVQHLIGVKPYWRNCYDQNSSSSSLSSLSSSSGKKNRPFSPAEHTPFQTQEEEQQQEKKQKKKKMKKKKKKQRNRTRNRNKKKKQQLKKTRRPSSGLLKRLQEDTVTEQKSP